MACVLVCGGAWQGWCETPCGHLGKVMLPRTLKRCKCRITLQQEPRCAQVSVGVSALNKATHGHGGINGGQRHPSKLVWQLSSNSLLAKRCKQVTTMLTNPLIRISMRRLCLPVILHVVMSHDMTSQSCRDMSAHFSQPISRLVYLLWTHSCELPGHVRDTMLLVHYRTVRAALAMPAVQQH